MNDDPKTDDLETLFGVRIKREHIQFWRDIWHLTLIFLGGSIVIGACGTMRYIVCEVNNEQKTITQCLFPELVRNEQPQVRRHK